MRRFTLGQRIGTVACLLLVTVSVSLFYFITKGFSKDIAFAESERQGIEYQRPLERLLEMLGTHKLQARGLLKGNAGLAGEMRLTEEQIDEAMGQLREVDGRIGESLQFTPEGLAKRKREHYTWSNLASEWASLKGGIQGRSVEESDKLHAHLMGDVRAMIAHAGDTSNLILDPDLDSYYLMDATLVALPQTQDRLVQIEILGQEAIREGKVLEEKRTALAVAAALLKEADLDRTVADVQTALNEDQNFYGTSEGLEKRLPPASEAYIKANEALLAVLGKMTQEPEAPVDEGSFLAAVRGAREASFVFWRVGANELDELLARRASELGWSRLWALVLTAIALCASVVVAAWVVLATIRDLRQVSEQLLSQSKCVATVSEQMGEAAKRVADSATAQALVLAASGAANAKIETMARSNLDETRQAAEMVATSQRKFEAAQQSLGEVVESIDDINRESEKIARIIKVIDEIAFQTNILALNAAVEAARAGAFGQGFAVVADEVRNLAQRSAKAARETASLVEHSVDKAAEGKRVVGGMTQALAALTEESAGMHRLFGVVSENSQKQSSEVDHLTVSIQQLDQLAHRTFDHADESTAAAEELNAQALALEHLVGDVMVLVGREK